MFARTGALSVFVVLVSGCAVPRGRQLCDAIARRDVAAVQQLLAGPPINPMRSHGTCVPAEAVFSVAKPGDKVLTGIGIELVSAGLPPDASWIVPGRAEPVWAIEAAAGNGNVELVEALVAVGLDVKSPEATRALVLAAGAGHLRVVQLLVREGADPRGDVRRRDGARPRPRQGTGRRRAVPRGNRHAAGARPSPRLARRSFPIAFPARSPGCGGSGTHRRTPRPRRDRTACRRRPRSDSAASRGGSPRRYGQSLVIAS